MVGTHTIIHFSILKAQLNMSEFYACIFLGLLCEHKILAETSAKDTYAVNLESINELITIIEFYKKSHTSAEPCL